MSAGRAHNLAFEIPCPGEAADRGLDTRKLGKVGSNHLLEAGHTARAPRVRILCREDFHFEKQQERILAEAAPL